MPSCKDVLSGIDALIDGETSRSARARFAFHLAMCRPCERYYRQYLAVRDAARDVDQGELPEDFDRVMRPILEQIGVLRAESE